MQKSTRAIIKLDNQAEADRRGIPLRKLRLERFIQDLKPVRRTGMVIDSIEGVRFGYTDTPRPVESRNSEDPSQIKELGEVATSATSNAIVEQPVDEL